MEHLTAFLERAQIGFAFAESGEMLSGRDKDRVLAQFAPQPAVVIEPKTPEVKARKQIGLGLGTSLPPAVVTYVTSACRRMDADLIVLCASASAASALLAPYGEALESASIACNIVELGADNERSLARYLSANSREIFVVSSGLDDPIQLLICSGNGRRGFGTAPVPIVVVAGEATS